VSEWFRGPLREMLCDHLLGPRFRGRGIVRAGFLERMLEEHESKRRDNSYWLWSLLMLELWFREWDHWRS
jgi:asparagine synthase (glutamine-hydrolysing)